MAVKKNAMHLHQGDKGSDVKMAQELLALAGSKVKATGEYTIGTASAVKSFQKKHGLKVTGEIDQKTWDQLLLLKVPAKVALKIPKVTAKKGAKTPAPVLKATTNKSAAKAAPKASKAPARTAAKAAPKKGAKK